MNAFSNKRSVIVDYRTNEQTIAELKNLGYNIIYTKPVKSIYDGLAGHADMQIFRIGDKYICEPTVYEYYKDYIKEVNLICGSKKLSQNYPDDIYYNVCVLDKNIILNTKYTLPELNRIFLNDAELNPIHANQGYANCSTAVVAENAIITADETIYKSAIQNKIDALKITSGYIELKGFDYGFIGGATGLIEKNILAVAGSLKHHPNYNEIKSFCNVYGVDLLELGNFKAQDIGSIVKLDSNSVK